MVDMNPLLDKNRSLDLIVEKECIKFCGLNDDCFKQYFTFYSDEEVYDVGDNFVILVYPPDLPTLIFTHLPKMQTEEFICFIASIFSLWFGFSIIMLSDVCSAVSANLVKIYNDYRTKIKICFIFNFKTKFSTRLTTRPGFAGTVPVWNLLSR
jgi:hypothetical protein